MTRKSIIEHYRQNPSVSVLIIGAGINGIGTFRDLALQGVDVLMVDKADFCSGASAASTRQAHGGLRYLEHGEFRLVRESLTERNRLLQNAPHAVQFQPTTIPLYTMFSGILNAPLKFAGLLKRPSERGYLVVKFGMMLYDWFTRSNRMTPTHKMLNREQALKKHPKLNPSIIGAATYYDCQMPQAERIGVEIMLDAEAESPNAHALNYCSIVAGADDMVELRDEISGERFSVQPKLVINAAGAWIDFVNRQMNKPTRFIGGTKGSHIVVDHPELAAIIDGSCIFFENTDGRLAIFMPFYDKVIIGATDIRTDDPDNAICDEDEIHYFLQFADRVLPGIKITRDQIVFHFCGVRPLPSSDVEFAGLVSRDHSIRVTEPDTQIRFPIYSLVGGKWTTFRAFAEQTTDRALAFLGRARKGTTHDLRIGGGRDYPHTEDARLAYVQRVAVTTGVPADRVKTLFQRYGSRAEQVAQYIAQGEDMPLVGLSAYSVREIMFLTENEKVEHVDDLLLRRTAIAMQGLLNGEGLRSVAQAIGQALGWSPEMIRAEMDRTVTLLTTRNGVPPDRIR